MTHDKLQSSAHMWMWNEHPELRQLFHSNFSDVKIIESVLRSITGQSIGQARQIIISKLKAIGLVSGTFDMEIFYKGQLFYLDAKIHPDKLSEKQLSFKKINEENGAKCYAFYSLEEFKQIIDDILKL